MLSLSAALHLYKGKTVGKVNEWQWLGSDANKYPIDTMTWRS